MRSISGRNISFMGVDMPTNPEAAFELFAAIAKQRPSPYKLGLATLYWTGVGTEQDRQAAIQEFEQTASMSFEARLVLHLQPKRAGSMPSG